MLLHAYLQLPWGNVNAAHTQQVAHSTPLLLATRRPTFRQLLAAGERDVVLPVLRWLLSQGEALCKRAFVGYHLTFPEARRQLA